MATSKELLKEYFATGKKPTGQEFTELIDAFVHQGDDLQALLGQLAEVNEAEGGEVNNKYMTPFLTLKTIVALVRLANVPELKSEVVDLDEAVKTVLRNETDDKDAVVKTDLRNETDDKDDVVKTVLRRETDDKINDREPSINKKSGFNLDKSDEYNSTSANSLATSKAVRNAVDHATDWSNLRDKPPTYSPKPHNHDDRYYTNNIIDLKLLGKAGSTHSHSVDQLSDIIGKKDDINLNSSNYLATSQAVKDAVDYATDWGHLRDKPQFKTYGVLTNIRYVVVGASGHLGVSGTSHSFYGTSRVCFSVEVEDKIEEIASLKMGFAKIELIG